MEGYHPYLSLNAWEGAVTSSSAVSLAYRLLRQKKPEVECGTLCRQLPRGNPDHQIQCRYCSLCGMREGQNARIPEEAGNGKLTPEKRMA